MTDQDLQNKYLPVADFMSRNGLQIQHFHAEHGKVVLAATAPTEYLKNRVWDEIKRVDSSFTGLQHDITVGAGTMYVVKSGDNLSNISKSFYWNLQRIRQDCEGEQHFESGENSSRPTVEDPRSLNTPESRHELGRSGYAIRSGPLLLATSAFKMVLPPVPYKLVLTQPHCWLWQLVRSR